MLTFFSCNSSNNSPLKTNDSYNLSDTVDGAIIQYCENKHIFDTLSTSEIGIYTFHYTNAGYSPLIIADVITSCGCIEKIWHDKPLLSGQSDSIVLKMSTKIEGDFQKAIVVKNNSINEPIVTIRMSGYFENSKTNNTEQ
ncbi:MAG: DUF1573 domain-containing protein [Prevotellaceae bacterium]|nr:DUF1573 domain-containing protein [Prevotellaceae bacterium]